MITWKIKRNMSDLVFLNRLIVFILLMSGGSTFSQIVEENVPPSGGMTLNNNETAEIFDEDLSPHQKVIYGMCQMSFMFR